MAVRPSTRLNFDPNSGIIPLEKKSMVGAPQPVAGEKRLVDPFAGAPTEAPAPPSTMYSWGASGAAVRDPNVGVEGPPTEFLGPGGTAVNWEIQDNIGYNFVTYGGAAAGQLYDQYLAQGYTEAQLGPDPRGEFTSGAGEGANEGGAVLPGPSEDAEGIGGAEAARDQVWQDAMTQSTDNQQAMMEMFQQGQDAQAAQSQQMMTLIMSMMGGRREEEDRRGSFTYNALGSY